MPTPRPTRRIRIIYETRPRPYHAHNLFVPFIRLRGRWLEAVGFQIGDDVRIEVHEGRLILTPAASEGEDR